MKFFHWPGKSQADAARRPGEANKAFSANAENDIADALLEIARAVSENDAAVLEAVSRCAFDLQEFFTEQEVFFQETGMSRSRPAQELQWRGLTKILEDHGYVCERDWKDEKEDFVFFFGGLKGVRSNGLAIDPDWLDETADIPAWGAILTEKWREKGFAAAFLDIDSDSYVLFPCPTNAYSHLRELAERLGADVCILQ